MPGVRSVVVLTVLLCGTLAAGCGGETAEVTTVPTTLPPASTAVPTTATTSAPSTTLPEPPTTGDTRPPASVVTTTVVPPDGGADPADYAGAPPLLLAHEGGIDLWSPGVSVRLYEGSPVGIALPDLMGGVIFQESEELYRLYGTPLPIRWIPAPGADPVVLVEAPEGFDIPVQVVEIDGSPTLLYLRWDEIPSDCADDDNECRWGYLRLHLVLRDLVAGTERIAGAVGAWESHAVSFHLGGDRAAVRMSCYGEGRDCVGVLDRDAVLAGIGQDPPPWIGEGSALAGACLLGPTPLCRAPGYGTASVALAPDGSLLAYVEQRWDPATGAQARPELVVFDPATGAEVSRLVVGPAGARPGPLAFDGRWAAAVLFDQHYGSFDLVLIGPAGQIREAPPGRPSLWLVAGAPRSWFADGSDLAAALPQLCDHWQVSEEPPPGEHHLACAGVGGGVLVPDDTGHYLTHPAQVQDELVGLLAGSPAEACEHWGGGPFLTGVNWWLVGSWDPGDLQEAARALGASFVEGIDCSPYLLGE